MKTKLPKMIVEQVEAKLTEAGLTIFKKERLSNDRGTVLKCASGEQVAVYDTGSVVPEGQNHPG